MLAGPPDVKCSADAARDTLGRGSIPGAATAGSSLLTPPSRALSLEGALHQGDELCRVILVEEVAEVVIVARQLRQDGAGRRQEERARNGLAVDVIPAAVLAMAIALDP